MNVYMYQAALYCESCGDTIREDLAGTPEEPEDPSDEDSYDSDEYPKGPFEDGGGEADSPQHCDACGAFLENPLTDDGRAYVRDLLSRPGGNPDVRALWARFYDLPYGDTDA